MCEKCINYSWRETENRRKCPFGRCELSRPTITIDRVVKDMMDNIEVYCLMKRDGCGWKGPKKDLQNHLKFCEAKNVPDWIKNRISGEMEEEEKVERDIDEDDVVEEFNQIDDSSLFAKLYNKNKELVTGNFLGYFRGF